jgi:hypothetical protein
LVGVRLSEGGDLSAIHNILIIGGDMVSVFK